MKKKTKRSELSALIRRTRQLQSWVNNKRETLNMLINDLEL